MAIEPNTCELVIAYGLIYCVHTLAFANIGMSISNSELQEKVCP